MGTITYLIALIVFTQANFHYSTMHFAPKHIADSAFLELRAVASAVMIIFSGLVITMMFVISLQFHNYKQIVRAIKGMMVTIAMIITATIWIEGFPDVTVTFYMTGAIAAVILVPAIFLRNRI